MSNAILTRPSAFPPPLDISSPFTFFSICGSPLSLFSLTTLPSAPQFTHPFPLQSRPLSLFAYPPFIILSPNQSSSHSFFCSQASLFLPSFSHFLPVYLSLPSALSVMLSFTLSSSAICDMLGSVCVCVCNNVFLWVFQLMLYTGI